MPWLKRLVPTLLIVAAFAVALVTLLSDHKADYGTVPMPAGGSVELPKGTVKVFYADASGRGSSTPRLAAPLSFQVTPAGGGAPLPLEPTAKNGTSETQVQRSEDIGSLGSIAKLDVPAEGTYVIRASSAAAGSSLSFGLDRFTAVAHRWELYAILFGLAVLIMILPIPRGWGRGSEEEATGWSSDSRAPYATNPTNR